MKNVAVIGECMVEIQGAESGLRIGYGGDTMNTAIYLARLGKCAAFSAIEASYFSAFGIEEKSSTIVEACRAQGVDMSHALRIEDKKAGLYLIETNEVGERQFSYWRDNSAARFWLDHVEDEQLFEILKDYAVIYLSGISLGIQSNDNADRLLALVAQLRRAGCQICFDSNYRPALWESAHTTQRVYQRMYSMTDVALLTFEDEAALFGDTSPQQTIERVAQSGVKEIVVKCGAAPCWLYHDGKVEQVALDTVRHVVDTTAAGDSFNAGYLAGRLSGHSQRDSASAGHRLASTVIQHQGAIIASELMPVMGETHSARLETA